MTSHYLTYQNSTIHYRKSGSGPHLTVCFHGFGEFAKTFDHLATELSNHTIIAIDLPFHGETSWREESELSINGLLEIIRLCPEIGNNPFGLMGYSMGGRVVLTLFETVPEKINYIVLIAPDGLKANPWYLFATQTFVGKNVFRYTMKNPAWFNSLLTAGKKLGMVNESIMKFVHRYIDDTDMRKKVYLVWTTMRKFTPRLSEVKSSIRKNNTPVYLIFGKYDRIIVPEFGETFVKNMEQWCRMEILEAGHQVLHPRYADVIARALAYCTDHQNLQSA
jgi:pimeloyl-ACP methyl ester carboxylesterase